MTTYNPISANLKATKPDPGGEAEGNCVVASRGGKQPEAKKQSQTQVNSIQLLYSASLLATGEACAKRNLIHWHLPVIGGSRECMGGWSENASKDVCVSGESCTERQRTRVRSVQQSEPSYELRSLVIRMEQREVGK